MEPTKSFDTPEAKLHFLDYWRIIRVRKTVILAVFILVVLTTTLVTFILPPTYASTARIAVQKDASDVIGINQGMNAYQSLGAYDPYFMQTEFEKIQSKSILHQVVTNLELQTVWGERYKQGTLRLEDAMRMLKSSIGINQTRNTTLIEIKAFSEDANEAATIANKIAEVYRESRINQWREMSSRGLDALGIEQTNKTVEILALQKEVDGLKETLGITDIEAQQTFITPTLEPEILRKLEGVRIEAKAEYEKQAKTYSELTNYTRVELKRSLITVMAAMNVLPDQLLGKFLDELALQESKLAQMTNSLSPGHPDVKGVRDTITLINQQIDDRLDGIPKGMKVALDAKKAHLESITADVNAAKTNDIKQAIARRPYIEKKRELETLQKSRDKLNERIIEEKVQAAIPKSLLVQVVDRAEAENQPVKPRKMLNIALGVIVGLGIGIGLAFFIEYLDTSVKTIDDVERALQAPVLGVIPQNVGYLFQEGPDSPHAEAYRVLRTNILFSLKDPKLNTITIVSGGSGEGKSTTIFNLATVFAQNGSRVLIVDSDLRRPSVHKILKVSNSVGLTNYLLKQNTLEEVIQTSPLASLDFMPSGKLPSSSMGVLSSVQMKELIRDLKRRYDYVFFDSPPIMGVSDASILASEVDAVLQVIQYRRYPQPMTIRAKQMIEKVGGNLLGIVLNNINMASDENYYYYSSGYYYDDDKNEEGGKGSGKKSSSSDDSDVETKSKA
jgi:capsular exopolysaccharide synthesis family protein